MTRFAKLSILLVTAICAYAAESLPVTPAESLDNQKLQFPTALAGMPAVCVFGFTKEAGDRTKVWMTKLNDGGVPAWSIADLEAAPSLVRGMIRSSMRKGTPQPLLKRSLIMTKDDKAWRAALGVKQENLPVVVLLDSGGKVLWIHEGLYDDEAAGELKKRFAEAGPSR